ncbi:MAG: glycoside hydrolase family 2 protein [Promethearchaeota archaeon]
MDNKSASKQIKGSPYFPSPPMLTKWGEKFDANKAWKSYPRPQLQRPKWLNLNGNWEYAISNLKLQNMPAPEGKIRVPFPVESYLSGVQRSLTSKNLLWYRRTFIIPEEWKNQRIFLHFGAVDWESTIYVNNNLVGTHKGGYNPFNFDITPFLHSAFDKENVLMVKVYDPTEKGHQPSGKQWLKPAVVFYTPISGIWQTVWIEPVSINAIDRITLTPDIDKNQLSINLKTHFTPPENETNENNWKSTFLLDIEIFHHKKSVFKESFKYQDSLCLDLPPLPRWTPEKPELFDLQITLRQDQKIHDQIQSYFAMRKFSLERDSKGIMRFHLNHKPYFMVGVLDQGYWPDGLYTAPNEDALRFDLEFLKKCGFNMVRKHIKTEPALWYRYCDQLGLIIWQDMPNGGGKGVIARSFILHLLNINPLDDKMYWLSGYQKLLVRENFQRELKEMVKNLYNFPSIAIWVLFNEAWGQFDTERLTEMLISWDHTRLVDSASGWFDKKVGHFLSTHNYKDNFRLQYKSNDNRGVLLSETGGYTLEIPGHLWNPKKKFGYKGIKTSAELEQAYFHLIDSVITPAVQKGLSGMVYTQITDVEIEYNGLMTYDRRIFKVKLDNIKRKNEELCDKHQKLF